jgi:hypothetical protein
MTDDLYLENNFASIKGRGKPRPTKTILSERFFQNGYNSKVEPGEEEPDRVASFLTLRKIHLLHPHVYPL